MVGGKGFEPLKAQGQQIYSLSRLTASVPTHTRPKPACTTHLSFDICLRNRWRPTRRFALQIS